MAEFEISKLNSQFNTVW